MRNSYNIDTLSSEEKAILLIMQKRDVVTKEALLQLRGIKSTTMNRVLDQLKRNDWIVVSGEGESTGGRKPLLYCINPNICMYSVGIHLALYHIDIAILDFCGRVVSFGTNPCSSSISPWNCVRLISDEVGTMLLKEGIGRSRVVAYGLSTFPAIDRERGLALKSLSRYYSDPLWGGFPIREALEREFGATVLMDTAANAGCIGESSYGLGKSHDKLLNIICGNSIRMGCITNGTLIRATNDQDDAFGHMVVVADGKQCNCGNYGCIDCYATSPAIVDYFICELKKGRTSKLEFADFDKLSINQILNAANANDPIAIEAVSKAASILGIGVANYVNLFDPDIIVLSGHLIELSDLYFDVLEDVVRKKIKYLGNPKQLIITKRSEMGKAVIGASIMALEFSLGKVY